MHEFAFKLCMWKVVWLNILYYYPDFSGLDNPQGEQANRPYIQLLFFSLLKVVNIKQTYDTCILQKE